MSVDLQPSSRMLITPLLKEGNSEYFDIWEPVNFPEADDDIIHRVTEIEVGRLDLIAVQYYNDPNLWWIIAHANKVEDIFEEIIPGIRLRVPSFDRVRLILSDIVTG
jgi:hypothetical protein